MSNPDAHGPIDTLVIEFPGTATGEGTTRALAELVDRGVVLLYDLMVVRKDTDGSCVEVELATAPDGQLGALRAFAGARSGLLEAGALGLVIVYENAWAAPFVAAARGEGAEMVGTARLTAQEIMDALDAAEAAD